MPIRSARPARGGAGAGRPVFVRRAVIVVGVRGVVRTQRVAPPLGYALRASRSRAGADGQGRSVERPAGAAAPPGPPISSIVAGEPGQHGRRPHRVEGQQPDRRAGRPGHRLVGGDPGGLGGRAPGRRRGRAEHDRVVRRGPVVARGCHPRIPAQPVPARAAGRRRQVTEPARRPATRPGPRAAAPAPAAARPPAARGTGVRASASASIAAQKSGAVAVPCRRRRPARRRPPPARRRPGRPSAAARAGTAQARPGRSSCPPSPPAPRPPNARAPRPGTARRPSSSAAAVVGTGIRTGSSAGPSGARSPGRPRRRRRRSDGERVRVDRGCPAARRC